MTLDERLAEASERFENPEPQIAAAVAEFCKNPYWREYYEKALAREEDWKRPECVEVSDAWERFLKKEILKEDYLKVSDAVYKRAASKAKSGEWSDQTFDNFCALADDHQNRLQGGEGWL